MISTGTFPSDVVSIVLDIVGAALLLLLSYYAFATLLWMLNGKLEKSWRYLSRAVMFLTLGALLFALSSSVPPGFVMPFTWFASTTMLIGTFLLLLGFRSHYLVWSGKEVRDEKKNRMNTLFFDE